MFTAGGRDWLLLAQDRRASSAGLDWTATVPDDHADHDDHDDLPTILARERSAGFAPP